MLQQERSDRQPARFESQEVAQLKTELPNSLFEAYKLQLQLHIQQLLLKHSGYSLVSLQNTKANQQLGKLQIESIVYLANSLDLSRRTLHSLFNQHKQKYLQEVLSVVANNLAEKVEAVLEYHTLIAVIAAEAENLNTVLVKQLSGPRPAYPPFTITSEVLQAVAGELIHKNDSVLFWETIKSLPGFYDLESRKLTAEERAELRVFETEKQKTALVNREELQAEQIQSNIEDIRFAIHELAAQVSSEPAEIFSQQEQTTRQWEQRAAETINAWLELDHDVKVQVIANILIVYFDRTVHNRHPYRNTDYFRNRVFPRTATEWLDKQEVVNRLERMNPMLFSQAITLLGEHILSLEATHIATSPNKVNETLYAIKEVARWIRSRPDRSRATKAQMRAERAQETAPEVNDRIAAQIFSTVFEYLGRQMQLRQLGPQHTLARLRSGNLTTLVTDESVARTIKPLLYQLGDDRTTTLQSVKNRLLEAFTDPEIQQEIRQYFGE